MPFNTCSSGSSKERMSLVGFKSTSSGLLSSSRRFHGASIFGEFPDSHFFFYRLPSDACAQAGSVAVFFSKKFDYGRTFPVFCFFYINGKESMPAFSLDTACIHVFRQDKGIFKLPLRCGILR